MSAYPVGYVQDPAEDRSRLTVFFRLLTVIPHLIWAFFYGIAAYLAIFAAWFAIVVTGRYPRGLYDFSAGYLRFYQRVNAYYYLVTDVYPPFDGGEHDEYPVHIAVAPPLERYSRLRTLFRFLLAIPIYILNYAFVIWASAVAIAIWFVAVITGRTSAGLVGAQRIPMAYIARSTAYFALITERWPPMDDSGRQLPSAADRPPLDRPEAP